MNEQRARFEPIVCFWLYYKVSDDNSFGKQGACKELCLNSAERERGGQAGEDFAFSWAMYVSP